MRVEGCTTTHLAGEDNQLMDVGTTTGKTTLQALAARWLAMTLPRDATLAGQAQKDAANVFSPDFERFFLQHEPCLTGYLWRMVGDDATACDLCQETFIRAWQHFA